jgi:hypothetical protein
VLSFAAIRLDRIVNDTPSLAARYARLAAHTRDSPRTL